MKFVVLFIFTVVVAMASAHPYIPVDEDADVPDAIPEEYHSLRVKRATCDVLSFSSKWFTPNHSACAIHCIAKGYKGGSCKKAICHCRR
uniref:Defensin n=1 Tax=Pyrrhocoris apterus TaxID=37000 RepID=M4X2T6_PYRAP|nr:defensin [Pyrrhocoris apterus]